MFQYKKHGWHWNDPKEKSAHCATTKTLIRLRSDNQTMLTDALDLQWKKWHSISYRSDFKGYLKRIHKIVQGDLEGLTTSQKLVEIAKTLNGFQPMGKFSKELMDIEIPNWGTVRDFCTCQNVPFNDQI